MEMIEILKNIAFESGKAVMDIYDNFKGDEMEIKSDNSPLTLADKVSNKIIVESLRKYFPDYAILSEEEKDDLARLEKDYCFIIDPLDGTKEFIKKNGEFTINIALAYKGESVMGVIYAPVLEELYFAEKGKGAWMKKRDGLPEMIQVSKRTTNLRAVASRSHLSEELRHLLEKNGITEFVAMGSSLKGCLVAKGEADIYFRHNPTMEWDTAAMQCIVEEAGGIFCQMDDSPMRYNRLNSLNDKGFYAINLQENRIR